MKAPGSPDRSWDAQNSHGKPKTDVTKSAFLDGGSRGVEMPGRARSGRVGTETEIRNRPPSKRARGKNTPFGQTPLNKFLFFICFLFFIFYFFL